MPSAKMVVEPLAKRHQRALFSCGNEELDAYLKTRASQDSRRDIASVFVLVRENASDVIGYYTLSMVSIALGQLPDDLKRRLPNYPDIPAALIGRLAVHHDHHRRGLGGHLLVDAYRKIDRASRVAAAHAVVVDPIDATARTFYEAFGFQTLTQSRMFLPTKTMRAVLRRAGLAQANDTD